MDEEVKNKIAEEYNKIKDISMENVLIECDEIIKDSIKWIISDYKGARIINGIKIRNVKELINLKNSL